MNIFPDENHIALGSFASYNVDNGNFATFNFNQCSVDG